MVFCQKLYITKKNRSSGNRSNILDICYRLRFFSIALLLFFYCIAVALIFLLRLFYCFFTAFYGFSVVCLSAVFCYLFTVVFRFGLLFLIQDTDGV